MMGSVVENKPLISNYLFKDGRRNLPLGVYGGAYSYLTPSHSSLAQYSREKDFFVGEAHVKSYGFYIFAQN